MSYVEDSKLVLDIAKRSGRTNAPNFTRKEEAALSRKALKGDITAQQQLALSQGLLIVSQAKKYCRCNETWDDLIMAGFHGAMIAASRFDASRGLYATYAKWWILQKIKDAHFQWGHGAKIARNWGRYLGKISKVETEFGKWVPDEKVSELTGIPVEWLVYMRPAMKDMTSLQKKIGSGKKNEVAENEIQDFIPDDEPLPDTLCHASALRDNIKTSMDARLTDREQRIVTRNYGLDGDPPQSLEAISSEFSLTRERIRQIRNIALEKLKRSKLKEWA